MAKTTLLRVKRRRDDAPPPSTFKVAIDTNGNSNDNGNGSNKNNKRAKHSINQHSNNNNINTHVSHLTNLMHGTSFLNQGQGINSIQQQQQQQQQQQHLQQPQSQKRHAMIFKKITHIPNNEGRKRKADQSHETGHEHKINHNDNNSDIETNNGAEKDLRHFNVIDATLTQMQQHQTLSKKPQSEHSHEFHHHPTKRKKLSLQMVDSRTMTELEFWNHIQTKTTSATASTASSSPSSSSSTPAATTNTATASASSIHTPTTPIRKEHTNSHTRKATPTSTPTPTKSSPLKNKKNKKSNIVLDPITKMINQSLISLHPSNPTDQNINASNDPTQAIMSHLNTIQTHGLSNLRKYMNWKCVTPSSSSSSSKIICNGSTILHMAAILNSVQGADYICTHYSGIIDFDLVDNDGYTARDVAELVGSDDVVQIISSYMVDFNSSKKQRWGDRIIDSNGDGSYDSNTGAGGSGSRCSRDNNKEEREEDYVYDVYCLKEQSDIGDDEEKEVESRVDDGSKKQSVNGSESMLSSGSKVEDQNQIQGQREEFMFNDNTECDSSTSSDPVFVQMQGGVGYWNEKGELILETAPISGDYHSDMEDEEEYDSNCEDCDANDYPDMEDEDDSDDDIYGAHGSSEFRNHAVDYRTLESNSGHYAIHQYEDNEDDIGDGEYTGYMDANESQSHGDGIDGETEAYDPYYDE